MTGVVHDDTSTPLDDRVALPASVPRAAVVIIAIAAVYIVGYAIWCISTRGDPALPFRLIAGSDSSKYLDDAQSPLWSGRFYTGAGPFAIYLLLKLCRYNLRAFVLLESGIAAAAWTVLAVTLVRRMRAQATQIVAALVVMGLAVAPPIIIWNAAQSTESLSLSTMALFVAAAMRLVTAPVRRSALWFGLATAVFVTVRDVNAGTVAVVGLVLVIAGMARADVRRVLVPAGAVAMLLAVGALALANQADPPRWYFPVGETILLRIRNAPDGKEFLAEHGMPDHASFSALDQGEGPYFFLGPEWVVEPEYADFRAWLRDDGRSTLVAYLRSHPGWALSAAWDARGALLAPRAQVYAYYARNWPPLPLRLGYLAYFPTPTTLYAAALGAAGVSVVALRRRPLGRVWVVGAVTFLLGVGYVLVTFHGDALEMDRHGLTGAVQVRLGLWLMAVAALDSLLAAIAARRPASTLAA